MEASKRRKFLLIGSISGFFWTVYLLYNNSGGHFTKNDIYAILIVFIFIISMFFYFRIWKDNN